MSSNKAKEAALWKVYEAAEQKHERAERATRKAQVVMDRLSGSPMDVPVAPSTEGDAGVVGPSP